MHRSRDHRIIAGVCGGIADSLGISPTVVRVLWLLLSLFPGPLWVAYVIMWILIPEAPAVRKSASRS
ncbi:PspC domain-containing protein [Streptosporangium sp. NPDC087985]|uniref:PspC domain-containing protein n=1 Tax=Streptosporangium sp. NPDC087985 TaxID=3366196 RepID=UPI00381B6D2A